MKKTINLFAALALAAGMFALAPTAAANHQRGAHQTNLKWACIKNDSWLLMRAQLSMGRRFSKKSKPVIAGHTACIKIPEGAWNLSFHAHSQSARRSHARKIVPLPTNSRHTHISVNAKTNWWGNKIWISGGPWEWSECGKCSYNDF